MQEALERLKPGEPFTAILRVSFCFAESFRVGPIEIPRAPEPRHSMTAKESKHSSQQPRHAPKNSVQNRIVLAVERVGVRLVFREAGGRTGMTLPAGAN